MITGFQTPIPRILIQSSHANFTVHATTGEILQLSPLSGGDDMSFIQRFDMEEWRKRRGAVVSLWAAANLFPQDILDFGYWYTGEKGTEYEPPEADFIHAKAA